jgi:cell division protein ZapA
MAEVSIQVGGRSYAVHCRDGEEDHLHSIAALVDAKAQDAAKAVGGVNETRHLLFAALLLADALSDAQKAAAAPATTPPAPPPPAPPSTAQPDYAPIIEKLAARIETLAEKLESGASVP